MTAPRLRWAIAVLLLFVSMIAYIDRLTFSVLGPGILGSLHLTERDYSFVISVFLVAYTSMYAISGLIVDRWGARKGLALFVFVWSIAEGLHAFVRGKWSLSILRFVVGLAEPGTFPSAIKVIQEWFSTEQRALGMGVFSLGTTLGAVIAPPLAGFLALRYGWRSAFLVVGALGLVWLVGWLLVYYPPGKHPRLREAPDAAPPVAEEARPKVRVAWLDILRSRPCLVLMLVKFLTDPVIYFVIFWLPAYLQKERGFDLALVARYAYLPYVFGGMGHILGGWFSGYLIKRGWSLPRARKAALVVGACVLPAAVAAPLVPSAMAAIAIMCVVVFGHSFFGVTYMTLPTDLFSREAVGRAGGLCGTSGSVGATLATVAIGYVVSLFSYRYIFLVAGLMHPIAVGALLLWLPDRYFSKGAAA